jgi:oxalate decarboxylase/phosphoglucose isomerase-like protein (cupin superfamily)
MSIKLKPKRVELDLSATEYFRILGGPPESVTMRSGYVVLLPEKSVGRHSTESFEEMIIVLDGEGEMLLGDGYVLQIKQFTVAYCPPDTEHDVRNTGNKPLRYVYVVAKA